MKRGVLKIWFFGDSICFGQGISPHKTWVSCLAAQITERMAAANYDITINNPSVNGYTTRQALERMPYDIQSHRPDVLFVQFGMNDCNCWESDSGHPRVSEKAFEANLEEIINRGFLFGAKKIFLNTNHPTGRDQEPMKHTELTYQQSNEKYNTIIRRVASRYPKLILNDIEKSFYEFTEQRRERVLELVLDDLLHLNEDGHQLYFKNIYPVLERELLELVHTTADAIV